VLSRRRLFQAGALKSPGYSAFTNGRASRAVARRLAKECHRSESQIGAEIWRKSQEEAAHGSNSYDGDDNLEHDHFGNPLFEMLGTLAPAHFRTISRTPKNDFATASFGLTQGRGASVSRFHRNATSIIVAIRTMIQTSENRNHSLSPDMAKAHPGRETDSHRFRFQASVSRAPGSLDGADPHACRRRAYLLHQAHRFRG
jgi:hypothetical protein